jgi:diguanylate cyclase (GGDEF)-like protein
MRNKRPIATFAPHEIQRFILPITLSFVCIIAGILVEHLLNDNGLSIPLLFYGILAIIYSLINSVLLVRTNNYHERFGLVNSILSGIGLGFYVYASPADVQEAAHILILLGVIAIAITSGRFYAYLTMILSLIIHASFKMVPINDIANFLDFATPYIISIVVIEAIIRVKDTTQQHVHRLETINKISRQIMLSLETNQTISLLNATMQEALEADTYFLGTVKGSEIQLDLFYDEGEYFNGIILPLEGTLSGWVIKNQRELFLPDLRQEVGLEGVTKVLIGKDKTSLSWMGVPLKASNVTGIISLGSYRPNAFDSGDMELLSNLAQHVSLALDNTIRHAQVEEQARLDSLTGVFNHGYFLKRLEEQAQEAIATNKPLSLIMMDIDYFKLFNDIYGHLVGDRILKTLCTAIRQHIKQTDAVGRWGGEEFVISLPGASGIEALHVAERISQTMAQLRVEDREQNTIPVPTVSQGIAVFPWEADEIFPLVDLADKRLYTAKERGRNQVEPNTSHWEGMQENKTST